MISAFTFDSSVRLPNLCSHPCKINVQKLTRLEFLYATRIRALPCIA